MADLLASLQSAAGAAGGENLYIEDVFSTYLYTGTGAAQTITNGIDLDGEGGLVWFKRRNDSTWHRLVNTIAGPTKDLSSNSAAAQDTNNILSSFNADGFTLNTGNDTNVNNGLYVSWTFRKAPKFFDVVTYTGTGSARTVEHNLGSVPGCIIVKGISIAEGWAVYHTSQGNTKYGLLDQTDAFGTSSGFWNNTTPTSTVFTVGTNSKVNESGQTYVAYLFAHDAGGFGDDGEQNVISCGSVTVPASGDATVTLGYEPQWILLKRTDSSSGGNWIILDVMRGMSNTSYAELYPNNSNAESASSTYPEIIPTATGFIGETTTSATAFINNATYIYIAIRRGPMKTPTAGTEVFAPKSRTGTGAVATISGVGFAPDMVVSQSSSVAVGAFWWDKLRGASRDLKSYNTSAEVNDTSTMTAFTNDGIRVGADGGQAGINNTGWVYSNWYFQRAPGFFDVVCYTGTGVARTVAHNLGVAPELMIIKSRNLDRDWRVYYGVNTAALRLDSTAAPTTSSAFWNNTSPTSSVFTVGTDVDVNNSTTTYVAYLFATLPGISKVGTYTGTGTTLQIDCGFAAGARFVLIRRLASSSDWYVWDTARGIVSGNDPYLLLNSTAAEVTSTDYIDPLASGFEISSTAPAAINASGGNFIFLAIA